MPVQLKERTKNLPMMAVPLRLRPRLPPQKQKAMALRIQPCQLKHASQTKAVVSTPRRSPTPTSRSQSKSATQVQTANLVQANPQVQAASKADPVPQEQPQARVDGQKSELMDYSQAVGSPSSASVPDQRPEQQFSPMGHPVPVCEDLRDYWRQLPDLGQLAMQVFPELWHDSDLADELPQMRRDLAARQQQFPSRTQEQEEEYMFWARHANSMWYQCGVCDIDLGLAMESYSFLEE